MEATTTLIHSTSGSSAPALIQSFFQNLNATTITIVVAVVGWIVALFLQWRNIKQKHRVDIRYDIYKQLVSLRRHAQDAVIQLGTQASSPFILMSASMVSFDLKLTKEYKGTLAPYSEQECVSEGSKKWNEFIQSIFNAYFEYTKKHLNFMFVLEDWSAAIKPLLNARIIFSSEINRINGEILKDLNVLQMYSSKHCEVPLSLDTLLYIFHSNAFVPFCKFSR